MNAGRSREVERACVAHTGEWVPCRSRLLLGKSELVDSWAGSKWADDVVGWLEKAWSVPDFVGRRC